MNQIHRVVFNKARGALMVVNEITSCVQSKGTKTVVAGAVAAMIAGLSSAASAVPTDSVFMKELPEQGLTAIHYGSNFDAGGDSYSHDFYAAAKVVDGSVVVTGSASNNFTSSQVEAIRGVTFENDKIGMSGFGTANEDDYWSAGVGGWVNVGEGAVGEWQDAQISVSIDPNLQNTQELDAIGVLVQEGEVKFTGAKAEISVSSSWGGGDGEDYSDAAGIVFDNVSETAKTHNRRVTFETDAKMTVSATGEDSEAIGVWLVANGPTKPTLEFQKSASIHVESAQGNAQGFYLAQADNKDLTGPQDPSLSQDERNSVLYPENAGRVITNGLHLTTKGVVAVGVHGEVGTFEANGKTSITAEGSSNAYGVALIGYGNAKFDGNTTITAKVGDQDGTALYLLSHNQNAEFADYDHETGEYAPPANNSADWYITKEEVLKDLMDTGLDSPERYQGVDPGTPVVFFNGQTVLNGAVQTNAHTLIEYMGNLTINGDVFSNGEIIGKAGDLTLNGRTSEFGKDAFVYIRNLRVDGDKFVDPAIPDAADAKFYTQAQIYVHDTLTLHNVIAENGRGDISTGIAYEDQNDITASTVVLSGNTRLTNWGGLHADTYVMKDNSLYLEENDEFINGTNPDAPLGVIYSEGTLEFAGGKLSDIVSGGQRELKNITLGLDEDEVYTAEMNGKLVYSAGTYGLDSITVNLPKLVTENTQNSDVRLQFTGGDVTVGNLNGQAGDVVMTGGKLHVVNLEAGTGQQTDDANGFAMHVQGGEFTFDKIYVNKANLVLTPDNRELKSGTLRIKDGSVESNYHYVSTPEEHAVVKIGGGSAGLSTDPTVTDGLYRMNGTKGSLKLSGISMGPVDDQQNSTWFKLYNGDLIVEGGGINIAKTAKLGANKGTITLVGGTSRIDGTLAPTDIDGIENPEVINRNTIKANTNLVLRHEAELTVGSEGFVNIQRMNLTEGSKVINEGKINVDNTADQSRANVTRLFLAGDRNTTFENRGQVTIGARRDAEGVVLEDASDFQGTYIQSAGKTTLTGANFFGGRTNVLGGEIYSEKTAFNSSVDENNRYSRIYIGNGAVTVAGFSDSVDSATGTALKLFYEGSSFTVTDETNVAEGAHIGLNNGTITLKGDAVINGDIGTSAVNFAENGTAIEDDAQQAARPAVSQGKLVIEKSLAVGSTGLIRIGSLDLAAGTNTTLADGAQIVLNSGTSALKGNINQDGTLAGSLTINGGTVDLSGEIQVKSFTLASGVLNNRPGYNLHAEEWSWMGGEYVDWDIATDEDEDYGPGDWMTMSGQKEHLGGAVLKWVDAEGRKQDINGNLSVENGGFLFVEAPYSFKTVNVGLNTEGTAGLYVQSNDSGNAASLTTDSVTVDENSLAFVGTGSTLEADKLDIKGSLNVTNGTLKTYSDQVYKVGLGEDGTAVSAGGFLDGFEFNGAATLVIKDGLYNTYYSQTALNYLFAETDNNENATVVFTGKLAESTGGSVDIGNLPDTPESGTGSGSGMIIYDNVDVKIDADEGQQSVEINKSFGSSTITVAGDTVTAVKVTNEVTLTGGKVDAETGEKPELIVVGSGTAEKTVTFESDLKLGNAGSDNNTGKISVAVKLEGSGSLTVETGSFDIKDLTASAGATVTVNQGDVKIAELKTDRGTLKVADNESGKTEVSIEKLTLQGDTTAELAKTATTVGELVVDAVGQAKHVITGKLEAAKLTVAEGAQAVVKVGTNTKLGDDKSQRGDLVIADAATSLKGLHFFLDPAYVDGQTIADASRLVLNSTTLDAKVTVGENSYLVLGTTDDSALVELYNSGNLSWGDSRAAVYVGRSVTVSPEGGILVDRAAAADTSVADGSVTFANHSVLVADAAALREGAIKTNGTVTVGVGTKAVLVGDLNSGDTFKLIAKADGTVVTGEGTRFADVVAGNWMWKPTISEDGTITVSLQDASLVYGEAMQGSELANAGMGADNDSDAHKWVNDILTDESGNVNALPSVAAQFDAAMNPAGALASFTTAYDRSSDLRRAVRAEADSAEGPHLWAQLAGGKTKLKGISTGGLELHTKTDAYGIIVGAEGSVEDFTIGGAITVGTGDTKNNAVAAKDDFDWYGFSVYGKTSVGDVDLLADASATFLKSDLTVGGKAAVDTDTTTAVWSIGAQAQKTFRVGFDLTPFIGMDIYHVRGDGYSNGHGASVQDANATAVEFPIGATIAKTFDASCGATIAPTFTLAVVPTVGDKDIDSKVKFAGAESTYNFTFADDVKVRANLGVNASKGNFSFGLTAGYEWGNEERSATNLMLRTKYAF